MKKKTYNKTGTNRRILGKQTYNKPKAEKPEELKTKKVKAEKPAKLDKYKKDK